MFLVSACVSIVIAAAIHTAFRVKMAWMLMGMVVLMLLLYLILENIALAAYTTRQFDSITVEHLPNIVTDIKRHNPKFMFGAASAATPS